MRKERLVSSSAFSGSEAADVLSAWPADVCTGPVRDPKGGMACLGHVRWLVSVQRRRCRRCFDRAEAAPAGARVAHQHDGRGGGVPVAAAPALANVGAARLFSDISNQDKPGRHETGGGRYHAGKPLKSGFDKGDCLGAARSSQGTTPSKT